MYNKTVHAVKGQSNYYISAFLINGLQCSEDDQLISRCNSMRDTRLMGQYVTIVPYLADNPGI